MRWFQRHIGPPPPPKPTWVGNTWRAGIAAAPVRLWAQILGFGTVIGVIVYVLHSIFYIINSGRQPVEIVIILAKGVIAIAIALAVLALVEAVAITELKLGFSASRDGLKLDAQHDDDPPKQELTLSATATLTPKDPSPPPA